MGFVNLSLLIGGVLVGIPVVLHLIMRQRPKQLVFPALRFVRRKQESNVRKLQLRHWLLLALRCLAIGLLAAALARPRAASEVFGNWLLAGGTGALLVFVVVLAVVAALMRKSRVVVGVLGGAAAVLLAIFLTLLITTLNAGARLLVGDRQAPVAAVLVFDTSPRMQFRQQNRTRLEQARETGSWLLEQLPPDSEVAVMESRAPLGFEAQGGFALDLDAAAKAVRRLAPTGAPRPLPEVVEEALQLASESTLTQKEIYVFTDLTQAAWATANTTALTQKLQADGAPAVYLIDVGVEKPINASVGDLLLSSQTLVQNGTLELQAQVKCVGEGGTRTVELLVEDPAPDRPVVRDRKVVLPELRLRDQVILEVPADASQLVRFRVDRLPLGVHHGVVRLRGSDGLAIDDERYFTVEVKQAWPVLIVAPAGVNTDLLTLALAPETAADPTVAGEVPPANYQCEVISQGDLVNATLNHYAAVAFLDPKPIPPDLWERLAEYVRSGGSLAIFFGHNARPADAFNEKPAQDLLPGRLTRQTRAGSFDLFVTPERLDHPALAPFRGIPTENVPWNLFPIFKHWDLEELGPDARGALQ